MRKVGLALLCAGGLFSATAFSITNHNFQQGLSVEYELPVNEPQVFSNIFFWTIKATCIVSSENYESNIGVSMLRKTGSVNEIQLTAGDSLVLTLLNGATLNITAESGSKVELVNKSDKVVKATCSTV